MQGIKKTENTNMPLYACGDSVCGGGDCVSILSCRKEYGYTIIHVGDRENGCVQYIPNRKSIMISLFMTESLKKYMRSL